jgi:3-phytase (myo-inositol-hexaphosphate 3-phosphohydrolase)
VSVQQWNLNASVKTHQIDITEYELPPEVIGNEAEGCVYDDENKTIFISREGDKGILKAYQAETFDLIAEVDSREGNIVGDPEGVAIYKNTEKDGFIILSSQGSSEFKIYERLNPYEFIGTFAIADTDAIDGVQDTDGIAVTSEPLPGYPKGLLVVQDGENKSLDGRMINQNFKFVSFEKVISNLLDK